MDFQFPYTYSDDLRTPFACLPFNKADTDPLPVPSALHTARDVQYYSILV